jgi:hypothetical protein
MSKISADITKRLTKVIRQQQALLRDLSAALVAGDPAAQDKIQRELRRLAAEQQRLADEMRYATLDDRIIPATPRARATGKTLREQVLDVLDEIAVPLAPNTISEFIMATTSAKLPASRFASLRRDEERAAKRDPSSRPAWIVPALSTAGLTPMPRLLSSSGWAAERRLVGARSLRVNHLRITLAFLRRLELLAETKASETGNVEALLWRYARGVPGAMTSGRDPDVGQIRSAIEAELAAVDPADATERQAAAGRLEKYGPQQQLWGLPAMIDGAIKGGQVA